MLQHPTVQLAGLLPPDDDTKVVPHLTVSYKPQKISPKYKGAQRLRCSGPGIALCCLPLSRPP